DPHRANRFRVAFLDMALQSNLALSFPEKFNMKKSQRIHATVWVLAFAFTFCMSGREVCARPGSSGPVPAPQIKYEKYTLKNGLEVILAEDHRLPLVAVDLWYHVGPANERAGRTGFAHLFEHMMFEGSRHVGPKEHFHYLEAAGASDINGTTDFDR